MSEEQTEEKDDSSIVNTSEANEGNTTPSLLQQTNDTVTRLEEANKVKAELLEREERLASDRILGGQADAGQAPPKKKELTPEEYAQKALTGELPEND